MAHSSTQVVERLENGLKSANLEAGALEAVFAKFKTSDGNNVEFANAVDACAHGSILDFEKSVKALQDEVCKGLRPEEDPTVEKISDLITQCDMKFEVMQLAIEKARRSFVENYVNIGKDTDYTATVYVPQIEALAKCQTFVASLQHLNEIQELAMVITGDAGPEKQLKLQDLLKDAYNEMCNGPDEAARNKMVTKIGFMNAFIVLLPNGHPKKSASCNLAKLLHTLHNSVACVRPSITTLLIACEVRLFFAAMKAISNEDLLALDHLPPNLSSIEKRLEIRAANLVEKWKLFASNQRTKLYTYFNLPPIPVILQ
ncbi:hypothetical protein CYMTET_35677 [Cymbomonas tetramitiformis]|uniref:Uncharacterized protein n=1 Tax=Cymbomonas tetramitiformis TaxID=36881 RepID=A0AAE0F8U6_9CHLO|nr:hypothetical protein CYMTET_35677 [Cymbomonas tetramitiformis]